MEFIHGFSKYLLLGTGYLPSRSTGREEKGEGLSYLGHVQFSFLKVWLFGKSITHGKMLMTNNISGKNIWSQEQDRG